MAKQSAGILAFRRSEPVLDTADSDEVLKSGPITHHAFPTTQIDVFLVHPGGPIWAKKDEGAWSIPKGEFTDEEPLDAAKREFLEETGIQLEGNYAPLQPCVQKAGKVVYAWAIEADFDPDCIKSNTFEMEWPPRSGRKQTFPEVDRGAWFAIPEAFVKINQGQAGFLQELMLRLENRRTEK